MLSVPGRNWEIVPSSKAASAASQMDVVDRAAAEKFLRRFKSDYTVMMQLRRLLIGAESVSQLSDDRVIERIAARLSTGVLVFKRMLPVPKVSTGGMAPKPSPKEPEAVAVSRPAARVEEPESDTFGGNHDGQAQAGALEDASESGTAFCEECEKLRRAAA